MMKIAVVIHPRQEHTLRENYILWSACRVWMESGFEVEVVRGVEREIEADIVVPHLDLTRVPQEYVEFLERHPKVANRGVWDISKTVISQNLLTPGDPYEGPVVVKTDRNSGGMVDWMFELLEGRRRFDSKALRAVKRGRRGGAAVAADLAYAPYLDPTTYPIFDSLEAVPDEVFENETLVVEKFLPERDGPHYCMRMYFFLGTRQWARRVKGPEPIVKARNMIRPGIDVPVSQEILEIRRRMGLDYGKIDYVVHEGRVVLIDVNTTPVWGGRRLKPLQRSRAEFMAPGIERWM